MFKSFKYLLKPTKEQSKLLSQWEGSSRWLWNHFLDLEQKEYAANKKFIWRYDLINMLPGLKEQNEWLSVPCSVLRHARIEAHTELVQA